MVAAAEVISHAAQMMGMQGGGGAAAAAAAAAADVLHALCSAPSSEAAQVCGLGFRVQYTVQCLQFAVYGLWFIVHCVQFALQILMRLVFAA